MRRLQAKNINQELVKLTNYLCLALMIKDTCQMMEFTRWLIFMKIVLQIVKRLKKIVIKKGLKKIVMKKILNRLKKDSDKKTIKKACDKKDFEKTSCQSWDELSSNIDEVIKTVLNFFILFSRENFSCTKSTIAQKAQKVQKHKRYKKQKKTQKHKKHKKHKKLKTLISK